jgi:hypothetical protein
VKQKKTNFKNLATTAVLAAVSISSAFAQSNLGANCGCPPVASRPSVLMSSLAVADGGANDGDLIALNTILDCSKNWVLDKKIFVPSGKVLDVKPGTVIKGRISADPALASALIVERGAKIFASGTADCQIVMTAEADPMDGTFPINKKGQWGGLVLLGKATNNLGTGGNAVQPGVGFIEGFISADTRNLYGMPVGQADDNDNSGILKYVSVRHAGAVLPPGDGNELNGISLGSVGRGTTIEFVEVISCADDNMEFFGGTVNVKHATFMYGNDDMFDWDLGYSGKVQFVMGIKSSSNDTLTSPDADNGFEADADDSKSNLFPRSHPIIYNCTMIGNNKRKETVDNTGMAAIMGKELTEGEIYNCVFANFMCGLNLWQKPFGRTATTDASGHPLVEAYDNWINNNLIVKNNTFIGMAQALTLNVAKTPQGLFSGPNNTTANGNTTMPSASDLAKFASDGNTTPTSIPGFTYLWDQNGTTNVVTTPYNATPAPALSSTLTAPADGFFTPAAYRGAFEGGKKSWLSDWTYTELLKTTPGLQPCPTDINADGITNNTDFLQLVGKFNQSCQ